MYPIVIYAHAQGYEMYHMRVSLKAGIVTVLISWYQFITALTRIYQTLIFYRLFMTQPHQWHRNNS